MELKGKKINFLGDSITQGVGTSTEENIYHQVLKRNAELSEARNYGISGTRIARQSVMTEEYLNNLEAISSQEWDFCRRADDMELDADAVVVFGGTNDYGHGDALFGTFDDRTEWTFYGACHVLFRKLIEMYPGKPIVIMTPLHRTEENIKNREGLPKNVVLRDYVNAIREVAEYYSLPVLDLYKESGIQPEIEALREMYMPDGLHPSDAGNALIADKLEKFLRAL
ncbi:MAG: SGNH/GDSL hydrolase family protein [Clostridia bacterium]|nr:SGNH/GDSL hydrolase family protein [Clostridia bacterium]